MCKYVQVLVASILFGSTITAGAAEPLRLGVSTWVGFGPFYIAEEKGFFEEEGIDVELIAIDEQKARFAEIAAGKLDSLAASADTMLKYLSAEHDYRYLFAADDSKGGDGIVARNEIGTPADLKGKRVAYPEGGTAQFFVGVVLTQARLTFADIESVNMGGSDAGKAFLAEEVDAAFTVEPWLSQGEESAHGHLLVDSSSTPGVIVDVVLTTPEKLQARSDDFKALYRAWLKAVEWQKANEKEADVIMARGLGGWLGDPAVLADARAGIVYYDDAMNKAYIGTSDAPGGIVETIAKALEIGRKTGLFEHEVKPASLVAFEVVNQ